MTDINQFSKSFNHLIAKDKLADAVYLTQNFLKTNSLFKVAIAELSYHNPLIKSISEGTFKHGLEKLQKDELKVALRHIHSSVMENAKEAKTKRPRITGGKKFKPRRWNDYEEDED